MLTHKSGETISRLGAASGAIGFAITIAAIVVGASTGTQALLARCRPWPDRPRLRGRWSTPLVWVGAGLQVLGLLCLFAFTGRLAQALMSGPDDALVRPVATASGAARAFVVLTLAGFAVGSAARFRAGPTSTWRLLRHSLIFMWRCTSRGWAISAVFLAAAAVLVVAHTVTARVARLGRGCVRRRQSRGRSVARLALSSFPNLLIWLWALAASIVLLRYSSGSLAADHAARPPRYQYTLV